MKEQTVSVSPTKEFTSRSTPFSFDAMDNGLIVKGTPTIEMCQRYWDTSLVPVRRAIMWQIGDFLNWVEDHYGDDWASLIDYMDMDESNVRKAMRVCRKFPIDRREVPPLSFTHYDAVAKLPDNVAQTILDQALDERLGRDAVRELVKELEPAGQVAETEKEAPEQLARLQIPFQELTKMLPGELADLCYVGKHAVFLTDDRTVVGVVISEEAYERMAMT